MARPPAELITDAWNVQRLDGAITFHRGAPDGPMERRKVVGEWVGDTETTGHAYILIHRPGEAWIHAADDATWTEPDADQIAREYRNAPRGKKEATTPET